LTTWDDKNTKEIPVEDDEVLIIDTEDSRNQKRSTLLNLGAFIWEKTGNVISPVTSAASVEIIDGSLTQKTSNAVQSMSQVGSVGVGNSPSFIAVSGKTAYVVDALDDTLKVIDITDPTTPAVISSIDLTTQSPVGIAVAGRYVYIVYSVSADLEVFDVSNPKLPVKIGDVTPGGALRSVTVSGKYVYTISSDNKLKVIDVSVPSLPVTVGNVSITSGGGLAHVYVSGRYVYVVDISNDGLKLVDVSDPTTPVAVGTLSIANNPSAVAVSGRYAFVVNSFSGRLRVVDVSNPSIPVSVGVTTEDTAAVLVSISVSGSYVYVTDSGTNDALKVFDVSDPTAPVIAGTLSLAGTSPDSVVVSGRYAYVISTTSNDLKVIDITAGLDVQTGIINSLEVGNLQVRESIIINNDISSSGLNIGVNGIYSDGDIATSNNLSVGGTANFGALNSTDEVLALFENNTAKAGIELKDMTGTSSISTQSESLLFDADNSGVSDVIIDSDGNVGISTTPASILHIEKVNGKILLEGGNTGNSTPIFGIEWRNSDVTTDYTAARIDSFNTGETDDGDLRFYTTQNASNTEKMRIDEDGNVGIGTVPTSKLHVSGGGKFTSTLDMTSQLINNVQDPISVQDAATKNYVDTLQNSVHDYSILSTYKVDDVVINPNTPYRMWICITAVTTPESFDSAKWKIMGLASQFTAKGDLLVYHGTAASNFGSGSDGQILSSNSLQNPGLQWISPAWEEIGRLELTTGVVTMTVPLSKQKKNLYVKFLIIPAISFLSQMRFNNDTSATIAESIFENFTTVTSQINDNDIQISDVTGESDPMTGVIHITNIPTQIKQGILYKTGTNGATVATVPTTKINTFKWINTVNGISSIQFISSSTQVSYGAGSYAIVYGFD